jgi:hypothetical protein
MKYGSVLAIAAISLVAGCTQAGGNLSSTQLESYFRHHQVNGHYAVAVKKRSAAGESYLMTIHGYPNNLSVCEMLIKPYNENAKLSVLPGNYHCEVLR